MIDPPERRRSEGRFGTSAVPIAIMPPVKLSGELRLSYPVTVQSQVSHAGRPSRTVARCAALEHDVVDGSLWPLGLALTCARCVCRSGDLGIIAAAWAYVLCCRNLRLEVCGSSRTRAR